MKGVDYSKTLSKERDYFQDTIRKNNDSNEKRIAAVNERNNEVVKKQRENFIEDKAELESNYQGNLEKLNEKTRASLENNNDKFHEEREMEREAFTQEAMKKRKDFDQRLSDIKSSYEKSFTSEKDIHKDLQNTSKKKYDKSISDTRANSDLQLKNYRHEMSGQGADLKDQYNRERQQLVRSHEDHMTSAHKDAAFKRAEMKDHLRSDFQKSKEVQAADFEQQKQYTNDRMKTMQEKYEIRNKSMAKDYSQRSDKLVETQQRESVNTNRENQARLMDARRDFNKQLRLIDLDKRRRDNGAGEFADVMSRQQGKRDAAANNSRFADMKKQMNEKQNLFNEKVIADNDKYSESLKTQSTEATAQLDRKLNDVNLDKISTVSKEREKAEVEINNRETQNRLERQAYEQKISVDRNNANDRLNNLKENFNTSLKKLEEDHKLTIDDVTIVSNKDKAEFVKKMTDNRNKEMFEVKREFANAMGKTIQEFELRLGKYKRDNEYLKMTMDQKVENLIEQNDKKLEAQSAMYEERIASDKKNAAILADQKEHNWKTALNESTINFSKKIDKMQIENDSAMKFLTNDYENKLSALKASTSKEAAQKENLKQEEMTRIKSTYENAKSQLVSTYENQISSLKAGFEEQMDAMKNFKRLS